MFEYILKVKVLVPHRALQIQFNGLPSKDLNNHLTSFLEINDKIKYNGVIEEAIKLKLFPFSLRDREKN